jgi:hypothetical protein
MDRASALQLLAGAPASALAPADAARCAVPFDQMRAVIAVGDHAIGLLEAAGTLVVCDTLGSRRYNVPRPPASQTYWARQDAPAVPILGGAQRLGDVSFGPNPDDFAAITRVGAIMVLAMAQFASHAYLVRFAPADGTFQTRALPFGGLVRAVYLESAGTLGVVSPEAKHLTVDLP